MLFETPKLTRDDQAMLIRVDKIREQVGLSVRNASPAWAAALTRVQRAEQLMSSNAIEGHEIAMADALALGSGQDPAPDVDKLDAAAYVGSMHAMEYVCALVADGDFDYDIGLLRGLHRSMTLPYREELVRQNLLGRTGHQDPRPGLWRLGGIVVGGADVTAYVGPGRPEVPALMTEFIDSLNSPCAESVIICAAMAHLNLVSTHPWADGNGRMSRAVQTMVLARGTGDIDPAWVGVEKWFWDNRSAYYAALRQVQGGSWKPERDARPWVRFCLKAHLEQAENTLAALRRDQALLDRVRALAPGLPEGLLDLVYEAARGKRVTNAIFREQVGNAIDQSKATRLLRRLVEAELLEPRGAGAGSHYVPGRRLIAATAA